MTAADVAVHKEALIDRYWPTCDKGALFIRTGCGSSSTGGGTALIGPAAIRGWR
jgi:hypothetical protein